MMGISYHNKEYCAVCRKISYNTKRAANRKIRELRSKSDDKERNSWGMRQLHNYPCPAGNGYHIGHGFQPTK